jgi:hypothetical protein
VDPQKPSQRLVTDLLSAESSTMVYDGVPITLTRVPGDPNNFIIHVEGRGLFWTNATDTEPRHAEVIVMSATFDKKGKEIKRDAKSIRVNASGDVPPTGRIERGIDFKYKLAPEPKATRARFVVRVTASGRIGTADVDLTKPPPPTPTAGAAGPTGEAAR